MPFTAIRWQAGGTGAEYVQPPRTDRWGQRHRQDRTMKVMAESFSDAGVPVFLCDVKGDVAGICAPGQSSEGMEKRIDKFGLRDRFVYQGYPTTFWDVYQEGGHAVRATVSDMGPELLSRILGLTAV